jgi:hypothetical protein
MSMLAREVPIESPCHVDWSSMTKREASKRFCGDCKKHVHDLSSMTEVEARALLESAETEGLCVRTFTDARGELVFKEREFGGRPPPSGAFGAREFKPDVPASRLRRAAVAALALAAPLSLTACMGAYRPAPRPATELQPSIRPARPRDAAPLPFASGSPATAAKAAR